MNEFQKEIPERLCLKCQKCCIDGEIQYPKSPWENIPDGCGLEGWIFIKREEHKQRVRKLKERLLDCKVKLKYNKSKNKRKKYEQEIIEINKSLESLSKFGSIDF